jgi:hypothetical protein
VLSRGLPKHDHLRGPSTSSGREESSGGHIPLSRLKELRRLALQGRRPVGGPKNDLDASPHRRDRDLNTRHFTLNRWRVVLRDGEMASGTESDSTGGDGPGPAR